PRSSTMRLGTMKDALAGSLAAADLVFCYAVNLSWDAAAWLQPLGDRVHTSADLSALTAAIVAAARPGDHVVIMSNGAFGGIHDKLLAQLASAARNVPSPSTEKG
ncbi:MAG: UDP-N-acetylmuramate:L-alanyl-gamma-D-glutamyl-meso-diaminopimelate ligase, partial [Pseudomonadota bacterium]|nr:UDP-N-acetylmuramate:L-alanyl-gamma-D-glutamyl-meso-diaminopimelate ligase [Pseudomonadota bacterium]